MVSTTVVCSIYIHARDETREAKTLQWYNGITQSAGEPFKLWLINDASDKDLSPLLSTLKPRGYCKEIRFFDSKVREGKAKKLNQLLRIVDTKYVAVVDNDVMLPKTWLVGCIRICDLHKMVLCGVLVEEHLPTGDIMTHHDHPNLPFHSPQYMGGACLVWNREKLGEEGFFNESFGVYGHEDNEFLTRLVWKGVGHKGPISIAACLITRGTHITHPNDLQEYIDWKLKTHAETNQAAMGLMYTTKGILLK